METTPSALEYATPRDKGMIWEHRTDGLFIQLPAAPREQVLAPHDRAVFRWFMAFAVVSIVVGFGYSEGMPAGAALVGLAISLMLAALLWRAYSRRSVALRFADLPTTIEIANGDLSIDAPHTAVQLKVPTQRVR